jgi:NADH-quinone oxidoreductase subunit E
MVNWEFFDNQTVCSARRLADDLRDGQPVTPTRGATLCSFRETARTLAGIPNTQQFNTIGDATLAGLSAWKLQGGA